MVLGKRFPRVEVNVQALEAVFKALFLSTNSALALAQLSIQQLFGQSAIRYPDYVTSQSVVVVRSWL